MTQPTDAERRRALASLTSLERTVEAAVHVVRRDNDDLLPTPVFHAERAACAALAHLRREMDRNFEWTTDRRKGAAA